MEYGENLPDSSNKPGPISLVSTYPIAGIALNAFVLIHNGLAVVIQIDHPHRADSMTVSTSHTFLLVDLHFPVLKTSLMPISNIGSFPSQGKNCIQKPHI
jgi:hypothetical protein